MSLTMILIPTAIAVAAAIGGTGVAGLASLRENTESAGGGGTDAVERDVSAPAPEHEPSVHELAVQTRMKDPTLLGAALEDLGALRVGVSNDRITAGIDGLRLEMARDAEGVWTAHFTADDGREVTAEEGTELIAHLDAAYARRVQQAVAERIRLRADDAGLELVSETREADETVTMVLNVREHHS